MYKDMRVLAKKNKIMFLAVFAVIGFAFTACPEPETSKPAITTITINTQPAATTNVTEGSINGSLSVAASVSTGAAPRYQWYKNTSAVNRGGTIQSGATSASFTIPTDLTAGTYYYYCEVRASGAAVVRSNVATVTVAAAEPIISIITITTQPAAMTNVTAGSISGSLSVTADVSPSAALSYQWYSNTSAGNTGGSAISAATSANFTIPATLAAGTYYYFCEVRAAGANSVRSNAAAVIVAPAAASGPVIKVSFTGTGTTKSVTLNGLSNNDIYLVKVNTFGSVVSAANTGSASGSSISAASGNIAPETDDTPKVRMGHPAADEYHANPPPFVRRKSRSPDGGPLGSSFPSSPTVGTTTLFWVETFYGSGIFVQKTATLRAAGTCGNIWVMNDLTTFTSAQAMADKFDLLYPIETSLLGDDFGGWDIDSKIQLLVYDLGYSTSGTTLGYFWGKDMRTDIGFGQRSNEAAMFYLNGNANVFTNFGADTLYSTLVHEFQHMIHHARKSMKGLNSAAWYNEMLSMAAEDVISPLIGIGPTNQGHPIQRRIPGTSGFLNRYYTAGITEWDTSDNTLDSYAIAYAFGAYLLRNYGGASLLQEMLANDLIDIASVTAALRTVNAGSEPSFEEALRRFGEALVFSGTLPADVQSFDKTVTKTIDGYTYTAAKFNIWGDFGSSKPKIFGVSQQQEMRPHSITVHQAASGWKNQSGTKTITLQSPNNLNVEFYLMVK